MDGLGRSIKKPRIVHTSKLWMGVNWRTTVPPRRLQPLNVGAIRLLSCCTLNTDLSLRQERSLFYAHLDHTAVPQLPNKSHGNCEGCHRVSVPVPRGAECRTTIKGKVTSRKGTIFPISFDEHYRLVKLPWRFEQGIPAASVSRSFNTISPYLNGCK